jgi:hypothetical protein
VLTGVESEPARGRASIQDDPRDAGLLGPIREHLAAEAARDIDWTLRTVTGDCIYEFPFQRLTLSGHEDLRRYYAALFDSRPGETVSSQIKRYWTSGPNTVIAEIEVVYAASNNPAMIIAIFGIRGERLASERIYVTQHQQWIEDWREAPVELSGFRHDLAGA